MGRRVAEACRLVLGVFIVMLIFLPGRAGYPACSRPCAEKGRPGRLYTGRGRSSAGCRQNKRADRDHDDRGRLVVGDGLVLYTAGDRVAYGLYSLSANSIMDGSLI